ncbi:MAG: hypothetical protein RPU73_00690, partial [Candidatus Sedimenticola sp. (ex Thyasira tokunagai)]
VKPDKNQLDDALKTAEELRDLGVDRHHLGRSLLYMQRRNKLLEELLDHVELYLQFGLPVDEHAKLEKLLERIRYLEHRESGEDESSIGLS